MRWIIGLGGLLVALGVIVWIMSTQLTYDKAALDAGRKAQTEVQQMGGRGADGGKMADSFTAQALTPAGGGKAQSLLVTSVAPGGAAETYFGLKRDDEIVGVTNNAFSQQVKDMADATEAKALVVEAFSRNGTLTVLRGAQKLTLPLPGAKPGGGKDSLQQQLDAIGKVPTH